MGHVRTQLNTYVYMYLDSIEGTEYITDLFLVYMIYVTMGRFGIEILCLSMSNFPPIKFLVDIVLHEITRPLLMMRGWGINSLATIPLK